MRPERRELSLRGPGGQSAQEATAIEGHPTSRGWNPPLPQQQASRRNIRVWSNNDSSMIDK